MSERRARAASEWETQLVAYLTDLVRRTHGADAELICAEVQVRTPAAKLIYRLDPSFAPSASMREATARPTRRPLADLVPPPGRGRRRRGGGRDLERAVELALQAEHSAACGQRMAQEGYDLRVRALTGVGWRELLDRQRSAAAVADADR